MCRWERIPDPFLSGTQAWAWTCCRCAYGPQISIDSCYRCDVPLHPGKPNWRCRLLIVGCARGATRYTREVLKALGIAAGHETFAPGATISCFGASLDAFPGHLDTAGKVVDCHLEDFDMAIHQTRHPLAVIRSWLTYEPNDRHWRIVEALTSADPSSMSRLEVAARYWLDWSARCDVIAAWRYRVEGLPRILPRLVKAAGASAPDRRLRDALKSVPRTVNATEEGRRAVLVTWAQVRDAVPQEVYEGIRQKAAAYGY